MWRKKTSEHENCKVWGSFLSPQNRLLSKIIQQALWILSSCIFFVYTCCYPCFAWIKVSKLFFQLILEGGTTHWGQFWKIVQYFLHLPKTDLNVKIPLVISWNYTVWPMPSWSNLEMHISCSRQQKCKSKISKLSLFQSKSN